MAVEDFRFSTSEILAQGGLRAARELGSDALELLGIEARAEGPVSVSLDFSVGGQEILLQGAVKGRWRMECGRCLAPATPAFESPFEQTYSSQGENVDVTDEVRETLGLAIPYKALCREDCKGLCPKCGKNLNAGPCACKPDVPGAFSKLKELKSQRKESDAP